MTSANHEIHPEEPVRMVFGTSFVTTGCYPRKNYKITETFPDWLLEEMGKSMGEAVSSYLDKTSFMEDELYEH